MKRTAGRGSSRVYDYAPCPRCGQAVARTSKGVVFPSHWRSKKCSAATPFTAAEKGSADR